MKLQAWAQAHGYQTSGPEVDITELSCDSRQVKPGGAFFALRGEHADGLAFVPQVLKQGAGAVLGDRPVDVGAGVAFVQVPPGRGVMADLAREVYGRPDESLALLGVTGTNGKTTTTMLIRQLLAGMGRGCGLIGTVELAAGSHTESATRTSPESPVFYQWLRRSVDAGDEALAIEVSSHALCMGRVRGARFRVGCFTNLTQDHLDFHGTMAAYFEAKALLFEQCDRGLANADDPHGRDLAARKALRTFGVEQEADYRAHQVELSPTGTRFTLVSPQGSFGVASPLLGLFNLYNLLAACAVLGEAGFPLSDVIAAAPGVKGAPGRLERVDCGQPFGVMVDYAHTPDALEKLLAAGKALLPEGGRLHVLFGCGGDRDRTKRPLMAAAVAAGADVVWHTSDNTRTEDPEQILEDAASGIPSALRGDASRYHRIPDRALAVAAALKACRQGDLLLLAGKGHEPYQDVQGIKHPYSDRAAVEAVLQGRNVPRPWAEA